MLALAGAAMLWRSPAGVRREPGLDVLLVSIDTLRADALGCYGRADASTPWIDRLSQAGVLFERTYAHNVVTLPSHTNLLAGRLPLEHGVRDNSGFRVPRDLPTLATLLKQGGYRTGAFVSAFVLDSRFGLDRGFDVYDDRLGGAETRHVFLMAERPGSATVEAARRWLADADGRPSFAFVHLYEPHFPHAAPEPFAARFADAPYQGEVAAADAALEPLLRPLLEAGRDGRTLVVLTSDHGEALGEHGEDTHGIFAYEATLRVPLILFAPRLLGPRRVSARARHIDVLPTVLDALGVDPPAGLPGHSLLTLAAGAGAQVDPPVYFEALSASLNQGWAPLHGVIDDQLKYVALPIPELYDLAADPRESRNLAAERPEALERLQARLAKAREGERGVSRVREEASVRERLRGLGYVATEAEPTARRPTEADDPKRLIAIYQRNSRIERLHDARRYDEAIALCRENLRERPDMALAWMQLASLERARGDLRAALDAARRALALRPADTETGAILGLYLVEAGRAKEAVALLEAFAAQDPPDFDVLQTLGVALAGLGQRQAALASFERARQLDPTSASVQVNQGTVHLMAGDLRAARAAFEGALALDAGVARAWNSLGVIAAREGRPDDAIESWRKAVSLDPRDWQTLYNLGLTLRQRGRAAEARPYLESYLREAPAAVEAADIARVRSWLAQGS
ncbi:MAG: sulfatase-like hydrolase/transferase [Vicinamibacteria bacterium]